MRIPISRTVRRSLPAALAALALTTGLLVDQLQVIPGAVPAASSRPADRAWTTAGDATGFHVLVADAGNGYAWRTAATLAEPGIVTDRWIGNACLTSSGQRMVVVYAPRAFTNKAHLSRRGGFTAVVDLASGAVTKLAVTTSLAYFNPGCGEGESVVLTQEGDDEPATGPGVRTVSGTRLIRLDAAGRRLQAPVRVDGQLTSAVPVRNGIVAAAAGSVVHVAATGRTTLLAKAGAVPFALHPDGAGGVSYLERVGAKVSARYAEDGRSRTFAEAPPGRIELASGAGGRTFLLGRPETLGALPRGVNRVAAPLGSQPSSLGQTAAEVLVTAEDVMPGRTERSPSVRPARIRLHRLGDGTARSVQFEPRVAVPQRAAEGLAPAPLSGRVAKAGGTAGQVSTAGRSGSVASARPASPRSDPGAAVQGYASTDPVDRDAWCSVPRNDPEVMAYQPRVRQVEWAVDYAIVGGLRGGKSTRPANFRNFGLPAYAPQDASMFPPLALAGGGRVPAQIMLGILAQESNLWQAAKASPGEYASPLIGNYYGQSYYDADTGDDWDIHWDKADCGYGIGQVTDGMRKAGREKPNEVSRSVLHQKAIALDYAVNIAAGLQILQDKWNQTYSAGLRINNADPLRIENWFFAAWAYNSGMHPDNNDGKPWGMGWINNPINPRYDPNRHPFLDVANPSDPNDNVPVVRDAAHPQDWPYQEKVIGWASQPLESPDGLYYRPAWWLGDPVPARLRRTAQKPDPTLFCTGQNDCYPGGQQQPTEPGLENEKPGPCFHRNDAGQFDLKCWITYPVTWKPDCAVTCGNEGIRYDLSADWAEPEDGTFGPPLCRNNAGLPSGTLVVDDVPAGTTVRRCQSVTQTRQDGTFTLLFNGRSADQLTSRISTHQVGGGYDGHFWFTKPKYGSMHQIVATWTPPVTLAGTVSIRVFVPNNSPQIPDAIYLVHTGDGRVRQVKVDQHHYRGRWALLGRFTFRGNAKVELDSMTPADTAEKDMMIDAVAFTPGGA
jgi:hypothetical protein